MIIRGRAEKNTHNHHPATHKSTHPEKVKTELSREQTALLKGAAIWFIMLHNYCRRLDFVPRENEFSWSPDGPLLFMQHIVAAPHPLRLALDTLAFLGHYGVPLFIFLSGYGLVKKYGTFPARQPAALPYMRRNARKFWRLMLPALLLYIVMQTILAGTFPFSPLHLALQILFLTNLNPAGTAYPGPYWYFGMTMQLYLLYRLCIHRLSARGLLLLSVASLLPQALLLALPPHTPWAQAALDYLRTNAVGALPPFCMGVYAARRSLPPAPPRRTRAAMLALTLLLIVCGSLNPYTWLLLPPLAVAASLLATGLLPRPGIVRRHLVWTGRISASIFVVHPLWRDVWLPLSRQGLLLTALLGYVVSVLISSWLYHRFIIARRGS